MSSEQLIQEFSQWVVRTVRRLLLLPSVIWWGFSCMSMCEGGMVHVHLGEWKFFADYIFAFSLLLFCSVKDDWYKLIKVEAEWDVPTVCNYHNDFKIMDRLKMKVKFNKTKKWNIKQVKFLARYELSINITWLEVNTKIQSCIWFVVNVGVLYWTSAIVECIDCTG